jgi:hypothetical protein
MVTPLLIQRILPETPSWPHVDRSVLQSDWCPSCTMFTPLLSRYYQNRIGDTLLNTDKALFQVVLVSRCRTSRDTQNFFEPMPWAALPHPESMGERGQVLMRRFGITTIPALVLLDGNGTVVCLDGRRRVTSAFQGWSPAIPVDVPPEPRRGPLMVEQPHGAPPTCWCDPEHTADPGSLAPGPPMERPQSPPIGVPRRRHPAPPADVPPRAGSDEVTPPPTKQARSRPPPKPNLMCGKEAVTFSSLQVGPRWSHLREPLPFDVHLRQPTFSLRPKGH